MLVCPVNRATRLSRFFLTGSKTYDACLLLGIETDTQDAAGKILSTIPVEGIDEARIREACKHFEGEIDQVPPVFSALKHKGKPLYVYAREGAPVTKPARKISIAYIRVQDIRLPHVQFEAACSSGTYIRTLCADIGKKLGCGGHLKSLRRIVCGGFSIDEAAPLDTLTAFPSLAAMGGLVIPMAAALKEMPAVTVDAALAGRIKNGKTLSAEDLGFSAGEQPCPPLIRIIDENQHLIAVAAADSDGRRYNYCCVFIKP